MEFNVDVNKASGLVSYPNLAYGFGKHWPYLRAVKGGADVAQGLCCSSRFTTRLVDEL
jgi:hypothetical protein